MKIKIDIDCTPAEARAFLGLPDVTPLHALYVARMEELVKDGVTPDMMAAMVKSWSTLGDAGMGMFQNFLSGLGTKDIRR